MAGQNSKQSQFSGISKKNQNIISLVSVSLVPCTEKNSNENLNDKIEGIPIELVSKELNHLAAILHVYAGSLIFMK